MADAVLSISCNISVSKHYIRGLVLMLFILYPFALLFMTRSKYLEKCAKIIVDRCVKIEVT